MPETTADGKGLKEAVEEEIGAEDAQGHHALIYIFNYNWFSTGWTYARRSSEKNDFDVIAKALIEESTRRERPPLLCVNYELKIMRLLPGEPVHVLADEALNAPN